MEVFSAKDNQRMLSQGKKLKQLNLLKLNKIQSINFFYQLLEKSSVENVESIKKIIYEIYKYKSMNSINQMRDEWYKSIESGQPNYSIYERGNYLAEVWFCWETCSKLYLKNLQIPKLYPPHGIQAENQENKLIVDMGNGVGITTAALRSMFPNAQIVGTNVKPSEQYEIARELGSLYDFTMIGDMREIKTQPDLALAFEYFEHFEEPLKHLEETIKITQPKRLLIASTFNKPATGHFYYYNIDGVKVHGSKVGKLFNNRLRDFGYEKTITKLWNNRPTYWKLKNID